MADDAIQVGDRVVNLSVRGIFRVVARDGRKLVIETDDGVRMVVLDQNVRRLDGAAGD